MTMSDGWNVLVRSGAVYPTDPGPAAAFLRSSTPGAYTTTRTSGEGISLLLWDRHLARLCDSVRLLASASPHLYPSLSCREVSSIVHPSFEIGLARAMDLRRPKEEIIFTVLVCQKKRAQLFLDNGESQSGKELPLSKSHGLWLQTAAVCDVYVHASNYHTMGKGKTPLAVCVAVMGPGRTLARAKCSLWARTRQVLETLCPSDASEIILSNDGNSLLEGSLTNFFVVSNKDSHVLNSSKNPVSIVGQDPFRIGWNDVEVRTAPLEDGVLPGIIRSLIIEVCKEAGIPLREVAPSWAFRHTWTEAFVTSSVRILQPVLKIKMPTSWHSDISPSSLQGNSWQTLDLQACGTITQIIHELVMERALQESIPVADVLVGRTSTNI